MKRRTYRLDEIARRIGGRVEGDGSVEVEGLASLEDAGPTDLSFFSSESYGEALARTRARAVVTRRPLATLDKPQIVHPDPLLGLNALMDLFYPPEEAPEWTGVDGAARVAPSADVHPTAVVGPFVVVGAGARVGARTVLYPGVYVGAEARIGESCVLWPNVVVRERCRLGRRVVVHPGAVIGADGFGYARRDGRFVKIRHVGIVVVEDDVEIGANATIDRATLGRTIIRRGVKLDNLVHIGHNVEIGEDSILAAQCGISGSTRIGRRVMMGGQVGVVDHRTIGDDAAFVAQSGVIGDVPAGAKLSGYPARPHREVLKAQAELRRLGRWKERLRRLEQVVERLRRATSAE